MVKKASEGFPTKVYTYPKPDKTAVQSHLVAKDEHDAQMNFLLRTVLNPGFDLPFHVHDDCEEIFTVIHGHAEYTDGDKKKHVLSAGDVTICRCGEGHAIGNPFSEPAIVIELNLPVDPKNKAET